MRTFRLTLTATTILGAKQTMSMNIEAATAIAAMAEGEVFLRNLTKKGTSILITGCEEV